MNQTVSSNNLKIPNNLPDHPTPGKISLIFNANATDIYHKFSPFTRNQGFLGMKDEEPFVWRYPDEGNKSIFNKLPKVVTTVSSILGGPTKEKVDDLIRISKFSISPRGLLYNAKQLYIQTKQSFTETRIYNPLSPILATLSPMTFGIGSRPTRHIEGGILGLLNSVTSTFGINISSGGGQPAGTSPKALSDFNKSGGKGLLRYPTANAGLNNLQKAWQNNGGTSGGFSIGKLVKDTITNVIDSTIGSFTSAFYTPGAPNGNSYRADEKGYELMANSYKLKNYHQMWYAKIDNVPLRKKGMISYEKVKFIDVSSEIIGGIIDGEPTGYNISKDKSKYSDNVKVNIDGSAFKNSDILVNYANYSNETKPDKSGNTWKTQFNDPNDPNVKSAKESIFNVIRKIEGQSEYSVNSIDDSLILSKTIEDYSKILRKQKQKGKGNSLNNYGMVKEYSENTGKFQVPTLDKDGNPNNNLRISTTFTSDGLNRIGTLKGDGKIEETDTGYSNWTTYRPYNDDLIAFNFYDVVNDKYIPFRATVKGIAESSTGFWDELRFIGRADQLYTYNGFNRTLNFSFNIVINSIVELLPTWKKINYVASMCKPSNYTKSGNNRFLVPPMFMITIGDMFKFQPMIIMSVGVNIPDDASWETLNEENSKNGWSYLNGIITAPNANGKYAQLPKEVEITVSGNLLEKERAIVGGSHFGHAPRQENGTSFIFDSGKISQPNPSEFSKNMIEQNESYPSSINKNLEKQTVSSIAVTSPSQIAENQKNTQLPTFTAIKQFPASTAELPNGGRNSIPNAMGIQNQPQILDFSIKPTISP